ncbi:MAG: asparagine--tRNA ligase [Acidobacteria bacterium]|nr:asparagine--tRNA ligase [Acidobacteriota bacterium]
MGDSPPVLWIEDAAGHIGEIVTLRGWVHQKRSSGKIRFLVLRDGTGYIQGVASVQDLPAADWENLDRLTQESSVRVTGEVRADKRSAGGCELTLARVEPLSIAPEYPIQPKEHGPEFLLDNRHLWLRSRRQHAIMRVRSEVVRACRDYFLTRGYTLIDAPIFTPAACEGTSTLFETEYFGRKAYLTQSGQLYLEPACMALGKVFCFGPTFRAEKSKTRRHLTEFWMLEPEVAFMELDGLLDLAEDFIATVMARVLESRAEELKTLERDVSRLEKIIPPFPRMRYDQAARILDEKSNERPELAFTYGDDFGAPHEAALVEDQDKPLLVTHYPTAVKAFYMQPAADDPDKALCVDVLAPDGYGEIIGGSQRIHDLELLQTRIREHDLPQEAFEWYLDIRRYGSVPHSGFGMGLERFVAWVTGIHHLRETIPYPRMIHRLTP